MKTEKRYYYFSYGMNTSLESMRNRCPEAISLGSSALLDWQFRFAYHADVVKTAGAQVSGVLWSITDSCLQSLDRLEGYPAYYDRCVVPVVYHNQVYNSLIYYMTPGQSDCPPPQHYWRMLQTGYREHNVTQRQLWHALKKSYADEPKYSASMKTEYLTVVH